MLVCTYKTHLPAGKQHTSLVSYEQANAATSFIYLSRRALYLALLIYCFFCLYLLPHLAFEAPSGSNRGNSGRSGRTVSVI